MKRTQYLVDALVYAGLVRASFSYSNTPPKREVFYVGGEYKNITVDNSTLPYMINQIYVEKLTPAKQTASVPLVLITGSGSTGVTWLEKPDGQPGWAHFFLSRGYTLYLTDQTNRGRSAWHPSIGSMEAMSAAYMEQLVTATSSHNNWPRSNLHTQWPGTGRMGDPIFDRAYSASVQFQTDQIITESTNQKSHAALLDQIGEAVVVTYSQSGPLGWLIGDARPSLVKGIIALEPSGPPFEMANSAQMQKRRTFGITEVEVEYDPPAGPNATNIKTYIRPAKNANHSDCIMQQSPPKKLKNLSQVPVLLVTTEASYHAPYDYCTADFLAQAGVDIKHLELEKEGILGNGHGMIMEKNSDVIAEKVFQLARSQLGI